MILSFLKLFRSPDLKTLPFEELRQRCLKGAADASREFISRYESLVWRAVTCGLPGSSRQDQEEVVANTFIALLSNNAQLLSRYNSALGLSPESYIRRQAVMQVQNRRRSLQTPMRRLQLSLEGSGEEDDPGIDLPDQQPGAEQWVIEQEHLKGLFVQLQEQLSPAHLLTFQLLYEHELEPLAVAKQLGCSVDLIYVRRKRILEVLEACLAKRLDGKP
jgi:RNA polymerase sigma factor (sigma-70 family)